MLDYFLSISHCTNKMLKVFVYDGFMRTIINYHLNVPFVQTAGVSWYLNN